ncbi:MAG: phosphatidylserine decarboxylase [Aeriscardovia sp.]|nr:phosphatidylserine decarboxylase [Aeriscardovia sp.]
MKKESAAIRFLYGTTPGRMCLKVCTNPIVSKASAVFLSSRASRCMIPGFIKRNSIDMERFAVPKGGYSSFNDFFTRKLKDEYRSNADSVLVCPCDGLLTIKNIEDDCIIEAKNSKYSIAELLGDRNLASLFSGGMALIFRLTPSHYHRYCYCASGNIAGQRRIDGILHCVRPIAVKSQKVYTQNSREYTVLTNHSSGIIVQMEVGAMLVGKISNSEGCHPGNAVVAGTEKGFFEYGGSTIIVLLEKQCDISRDIMEREAIDGEIPVTIGEALLGEMKDVRNNIGTIAG